MQPTQKPTLGRIVHYTCNPDTAGRLNALGGRKYNVNDIVPGIIVRAGDNNQCNLTLFPDADQVYHIAGVAFSNQGQPGTWGWPERIGEEAAA